MGVGQDIVVDAPVLQILLNSYRYGHDMPPAFRADAKRPRRAVKRRRRQDAKRAMARRLPGPQLSMSAQRSSLRPEQRVRNEADPPLA